MKILLFIGLGGAFGALSRHFLATTLDRWSGDHAFPWGILAANVLGCLLIGLLLGISEQMRAFSAETRGLLITGFLGSLTTFSTFGANTFDLMRKGQVGLGLANVGGSVVLGLGAVWLGYSLILWSRGGAASAHMG